MSTAIVVDIILTASVILCIAIGCWIANRPEIHSKLTISQKSELEKEIKNKCSKFKR